MDVYFCLAVAKNDSQADGRENLRKAHLAAQQQGKPLVFVLVNGYEHGSPTRKTVIATLERIVNKMRETPDYMEVLP